MPRVLSAADVSAFRERLIDVAEALFAEFGSEAVTIRQIATSLGVSSMTPYRYFKDKDEILAAVRTTAFDRFAAALEVARVRGGTPIAVSRRVGRAYARFAIEHQAAYRLMFDLNQPTETHHPKLTAAVERARRTMTAHVEDMIDAGILKGDPELIGHVFWALLHGIVVLQLAGKIAPSVDPERLRATAFEIISRGLGLHD